MSISARRESWRVINDIRAKRLADDMARQRDNRLAYPELRTALVAWARHKKAHNINHLYTININTLREVFSPFVT